MASLSDFGIMVGLSKEEVFVTRLSHMGVIVGAGKRTRGKTPSWLSTDESLCPKCGRSEYANAEPDRVKLCGLCLANECIKSEGQEELTGPPLSAKPRPFRAPTKPAKICERCSGSFRGRSNAQRFCPHCQDGNETTKNRERQARFQKDHKNGHGLTV